jgi:hypothetical protein
VVVFIPNFVQKNPGHFCTIDVSTTGKFEVVVVRNGRFCLRDFAFTFSRHKAYWFIDKYASSAYISAETTYFFNFTVNCGRI